MDNLVPRLNTTIDPKAYQELVDKMRWMPGGIRWAARTAINKVAAKGRTQVARLVAEAMTARISSVNKRITVTKATDNRLFATLNLHGNHGVSLIGFSAKQNATGVVAKVLGQEKEYPHAFIRRGVGGNSEVNSVGKLVVFLAQGQKRIMEKGRYKGKMRKPLIVLKGPTVPETFKATPGLAEKALSAIRLDLAKTLNAQVKFLLERGSIPTPGAMAAKAG